MKNSFLMENDITLRKILPSTPLSPMSYMVYASICYIVLPHTSINLIYFFAINDGRSLFKLIFSFLSTHSNSYSYYDMGAIHADGCKYIQMLRRFYFFFISFVCKREQPSNTYSHMQSVFFSDAPRHASILFTLIQTHLLYVIGTSSEPNNGGLFCTISCQIC